MIIEIIQSNLAPGKDFGIFRQLRHLFEIGIAGEFGFMRINPNRGINEVMLLGKADCAVERPWSGTAADGENSFNTRVPGSLQHGRAISIELLHFEMCVGIDEE